MIVCTRCFTVRPKPPTFEEMLSSAEIRENWSKYGEGWMVLTYWDGHDKYYLCPRCSKSVMNRIVDDRATVFKRS